MGVAIKPCSMPNVRRGGGYRNRKPEYEQAFSEFIESGAECAEACMDGKSMNTVFAAMRSRAERAGNVKAFTSQGRVYLRRTDTEESDQ